MKKVTSVCRFCMMRCCPFSHTTAPHFLTPFINDPVEAFDHAIDWCVYSFVTSAIEISFVIADDVHVDSSLKRHTRESEQPKPR